MNDMAVTVSAAVEGDIDEAVVRKLFRHVGGEAGTVYGKSGKQTRRERIKGYNNAARFAPWFVLADLDTDAECAKPLTQRWLPKPARYLCFRIAVRKVEAWLMADVETIAQELGIAQSAVSLVPEDLPDPKVA